MILLLVVGCLRMLDNPNNYVKKYYPHSSELIPLLHEMVLEERKNMLGSINGDGTFTGMKRDAFSDSKIKSVRIPGDAHIHFLNIHNKGIEEVDKFFTWIKNEFSIDVQRSWIIYYSVGEAAFSHCHKEYDLTFNYAINVPENSSPLVIDEYAPFNIKRQVIPSNTGEVNVFGGKFLHSVEPAKVEGKCMLVGTGFNIDTKYSWR